MACLFIYIHATQVEKRNRGRIVSLLPLFLLSVSLFLCHSHTNIIERASEHSFCATAARSQTSKE